VKLLPDVDPAVLVNRYFDLCRAFTALHSGAPSIEHIKRKAALKGILAAVRCEGLRSMPAVLRQAYRLHYGALFDFLKLLPRAVFQRVGAQGRRFM